MDAWLTEAAGRLGDGAVSDAEAEALLELARVAAHESGDRRNAPLLSYLVGLAAARSGRPVSELVDEALGR